MCMYVHACMRVRACVCACVRKAPDCAARVYGFHVCVAAVWGVWKVRVRACGIAQREDSIQPPSLTHPPPIYVQQGSGASW